MLTQGSKMDTTMTKLSKLIENFQTKHQSPHEFLGVLLQNEAPDFHTHFVEVVWGWYLSDKAKRATLILERLGHQLNAKAKQLDELERKKSVGLLSKEEHSTMEELDKEGHKLYQNSRHPPKLSGKEQAVEDLWERKRFAWLAEQYLVVGNALPQMVYQGTLSCPPDAAIDYMLPKQREVFTPNPEDLISEKPEDYPKGRIHIEEVDINSIKKELISSLRNGSIPDLQAFMDKAITLPIQTQDLTFGATLDLLINDVEERYIQEIRLLGLKLNPIAIERHELERKNIAGLLSDREAELYMKRKRAKSSHELCLHPEQKDFEDPEKKTTTR